MGKYFGSELTSSKADIYNKSSIVSHPDNYSVNGLKQTWACNRHIVGFYCSLVLCVSEQSKPETQKRIPSKLVCFTGRNWAPTMCLAPQKQHYMCFPSHQLLLKIYLNLVSPTGRYPSSLERLAGSPRPGPTHFPPSMPGPCSLHPACPPELLKALAMLDYLHLCQREALHRDCGSLFPPLPNELWFIRRTSV